MNWHTSQLEETDVEYVRADLAAPVPAEDGVPNDARVVRLEAQLNGLMNCLAKSQQEVEQLRAAAWTPADPPIRRIKVDSPADSGATDLAVGEDRLPAVGGRICEWSLSEFEHRCRVHLMREQEKPLPDNGLIAVLCNAVRLAREQADYMKANTGKLVAALATPATGDAARKLAEEITAFINGATPLALRATGGPMVERLTAIISRHFAATPVKEKD